ncbi:MAG: RsmG family class I SAM-dependent methyltransferase [Actinomycetota bacterium]
MKHPIASLKRVATYVGLTLEPAQLSRLVQYAEWIEEEAIPAGGVGPQERDRLVDRHVADSLAFAAGWRKPPGSLLDIGSGVGLPGIPLAITHPETNVTLLDRAERRCRLARRAVRVLGIDNVVVKNGDEQSVAGGWDAIVFRASLEPDEALRTAAPLLAPGAVAVVGLSRTSRPERLPSPPEETAVDLIEIPAGVLDSPAWLLRMTRTNAETPGNAPI